MEKKFYLRGYKGKVGFPILFDDAIYSFEEARDKAREYFDQIAPLCKVIIFEQGNGEGERAARFIYRNESGKPQEIGDWWENY
jgi:hypothetical protein